MRHSRLVLATALCSAVILSGQAGAAAPAPLVMPDAANDANAVNDQIEEGVGVPVGSQPEKDFTSVKLEAISVIKKKKRVCTGFTATLTLSGSPATANTIYRITGKSKVNAVLFWLFYDGTNTAMRIQEKPSTAPSSVTIPLKKAAVIAGKTITITVTASDLKAANETVAGFNWGTLGAETRSSFVVPGVVSLTAPLWDSVSVDSAKTFALC